MVYSIEQLLGREWWVQLEFPMKDFCSSDFPQVRGFWEKKGAWCKILCDLNWLGWSGLKSTTLVEKTKSEEGTKNESGKRIKPCKEDAEVMWDNMWGQLGFANFTTPPNAGKGCLLHSVIRESMGRVLAWVHLGISFCYTLCFWL